MRDHIAYESAHDRVAALLAAAAAPAEAPVPGEAEALVAFRAATGSPAQLPRRRMKIPTTAKFAAVTALSAMSLVGGGYAVAATAGSNVDLCLITSAAVVLAGHIGWVQQ